jgi:hypothetical protein
MLNEAGREGLAEGGWLELVSPDDRAFIGRFLLASGSLKEVARQYGVSYPTVRRRLDRLIAKLEVLEDRTITSRFERLLRAAFADGRLDAATASSLLAAHREEKGEDR